jgi:channel protein (hemolysin III family)
MLLLLALWAAAIVGSVIELVPSRGPRRSTLLYILMGFSYLFWAPRLLPLLSPTAFDWMVVGTVTYAAGGLALMLPIPRRHEIWHVLALGGGAFQFIGLYFHVHHMI